MLIHTYMWVCVRIDAYAYMCGCADFSGGRSHFGSIVFFKKLYLFEDLVSVESAGDGRPVSPASPVPCFFSCRLSRRPSGNYVHKLGRRYFGCWFADARVPSAPSNYALGRRRGTKINQHKHEQTHVDNRPDIAAKTLPSKMLSA